MNTTRWDRETREAYEAMRQYRTACDRYLRAVPTPDAARQEFDEALVKLIDSLRNPVVFARIGRVIGAGTQARRAKGIDPRPRLQELELEIALSRHFGLNPGRVQKAIGDDNHAHNGIATSDELISEVTRLHKEAIEGVESAREMRGRLPKKKRKRRIGQGVTSLIFGTGCTVANSYTIAAMPAMAVSYSVALAAFHQSARDLVGERDD